MVQIIRGPESQSSIRQRALNESLSGAINAWGDMEQADKKEAATQRQQALDLMKTTQDLRKEGYDVTEDQVKQYLAPEKTQSFGDKLKTMFTGEEALKQERPDLYAKRTPEYIAKQEQAKATAELEGKAKKAELETKEYSLQELKEASPYKRRKMELENKNAQQEASLFDLKRQKLQADIGKINADSQKAQREASQVTNSFSVPGYKNIAGTKPTEKDTEELKKLSKTTTNILNASNILKQSVSKYGVSSGLGFSEGGRQVDQDLTNLQIELKNLYELGALSGPDMGLVNNAIGKVSGVSAYLTPGNDKASAIQQVQNIVEKAILNQQSGARARGFEPETKTENTVQQNAGEITKQVQSMSRADKIKLLQAGG